jgi:hypothetical protein
MTNAPQHRFSRRGASLVTVLTALAGVFAASALAAPPVNTAAPTISGTEREGATLTTSNGTWSNSPNSFTYRWQRCAADGTSCTNITGATARSYRLTTADEDRTVRSAVTASNADGEATAFSRASDVISSSAGPRNTAAPRVTGTPAPGNELTAENGTWTGGVRSYAYQWQTCDSAGANCTNVSGATGKTYGVRAGDVNRTIRVVVTATSPAGSTSASSDATGLVRAVTTTTPAPTPGVNRAPTIRFLSVRFQGARVYVRMRVCDDSRKNVTIIARDSKPGVASYTRRFRTVSPPRTCAALTRNWLPAQRFRKGRYTITLQARDTSGKSSASVRRTFNR